MSLRVPISIYRLQFNREFGFSDAQKIVTYLDELGLTHIHASPILKARPGSIHGYDVTNPSQFSPEIGSAEQFEALSTKLQARGMGILLDIVPNHMAASLDNPWWFDVLEKGPQSEYAPFFDVNWESKKILLPILGRPYGEALDNEELQLKVVGGRPVIQYYDRALPVDTIAPRGTESLDEILSRQHYRLAHWRKAADAINYRRFFDISDLVGLRAERDDVFKATHELILKLVAQGQVDGLRIDHIDGLLDPKGYLDRLPPIYVVVEKILAGREQLPCDWRAHGTTGYDFLNIVNGAFIDRDGYRRLEAIYREFTGIDIAYVEAFRSRKRQVIDELFSGEVNALLDRLAELAEEDRHARDLRVEDLKESLVSVTACLPVYRTYIRDYEISDVDRAVIEDTLAVSSGAGVPFLRRVLLLDPAWYLEESKAAYLDFIMRWQQFTSPVMAKGLEDTTLYVHNPLVSVNEVGAASNGPEVYFGVDEFHRRMETRRSNLPLTMNASSTHDTKRSEDVRARINVLSELPMEWARGLRRWSRLNPSDTAPDYNEQVLIYQSMLGSWPIEADRLKQYVTKALREGKTHSNWIDIDADYERSVLSFVERLYSSEEFLKDFLRLQKKLAYFGALSSLSQSLLKIGAPGVPDFYQGTEVWDLSLADPDNRRPVDFASRQEMIESLKKRARPKDLLRSWADGRIKMFLVWKALRFRRTQPELFLQGDYIPLRISGSRADHIIAFARRLGNQWVLIAVPRLLAALTRPGSPPIGEKVWQDTGIETPPEAPRVWLDVFTALEVSSLRASSVFSTLPFSLLLGRTGAEPR